MDVYLLCLFVVLSCVGSGLCNGLITRPEESYRMSNSVWLRNLKGGDQGPFWAVEPLDGRDVVNNYHLSFVLFDYWYWIPIVVSQVVNAFRILYGLRVQSLFVERLCWLCVSMVFSSHSQAILQPLVIGCDCFLWRESIVSIVILAPSAYDECRWEVF
jgi:hypothetical protein